jgi:hypothetical protein
MVLLRITPELFIATRTTHNYIVGHWWGLQEGPDSVAVDASVASVRVLYPIRAPRGCTKDEGRPLGVGLQEQAPNHLKLHLLRAGVVSVKEKALVKVSGVNQQR